MDPEDSVASFSWKKKKFISHVQDGGEVPFYLWESVLGRRLWCSEARLNMPVKNLLELGKKDLWLIFSIFSLFLWAAFLCVTVQMLFPFTCASREFRLNSCAVTLLQLGCFPILKCLLHQHCNNESILIATISLFYEWKDKYKKPKNLFLIFFFMFSSCLLHKWMSYLCNFHTWIKFLYFRIISCTWDQFQGCCWGVVNINDQIHGPSLFMATCARKVMLASSTLWSLVLLL